MNVCVVMTILATDRPGIVQALSHAIADHGGNWLESRMARMAGQFAGILRVECPADQSDDLITALEGLEGMSIQARKEVSAPVESRHLLRLDVVGNDRPGIVRALSGAVAAAGANVEELETTLESAPMSGHPIFHATGIASLPGGVAPGTLRDAIENLGADLAVTVEDCEQLKVRG